MEDWRGIPDYVGFYEVSDLGRIRSLVFRGFVRKNPKILRPAINKKTGYLCFTASVNNKRKLLSVHRCVLLAFVGPPPVGHEACHVGTSQLDNKLSSLKWGTKQENMSHKEIQGTSQRAEKNPNAVLDWNAVR